MARSQRLRLDDIRAIIRLVREVCELGDDCQTWRTHMLTQLRQLIGAGIGVHYLHDLPADTGNMRYRGYIDVAADPLWHRYIANRDLSPDPMTPGMTALVGRTVVRTEDQLCTPKQWYDSEHFNELYRPLRADHELASLAVLPDRRCFSGIGFGRYLGDPAFGRRERELVRLFHTELIELWRTPVAASGNHRIESGLSPRLRQTLDLLRQGLGEKQIAARLKLSAHTVHDYVKELHRRADAHSVTELLARLQPAPNFRPTIDSI